MSIKYCRDQLRTQVLSFTKGKDLKKDWVIEKKVEYNGKKYDNLSGTKCDEESGMWRMGYQLFPSEEIDGYKFIHYTILHGVVKVNAEINLNKKLTCMGGFYNTFMTGMKYMSPKDMCDDYLQPLLIEKSDGLITEVNGFTFKYVTTLPETK